MNKALRALLVPAAVLMLLSSAEAGISNVTIMVDGLACPFCAYGVEKKLKRIKGIGTMDIKMAEGIVAIGAGPGLSVDIGQVPQAIRDSGFSMREIRAVATGVVRDDDSGLTLQYGEPDEVFQLKRVSSPALMETLTGYVKSGGAVKVSGIVRQGEPWSLLPESVEGALP